MNGRLAKKMRKAIQKMQGNLASDLKTWLNEQPLRTRMWIAASIIFRRPW
jgi:hypothetical protein